MQPFWYFDCALSVLEPPLLVVPEAVHVTAQRALDVHFPWLRVNSSNAGGEFLCGRPPCGGTFLYILVHAWKFKPIWTSDLSRLEFFQDLETFSHLAELGSGLGFGLGTSEGAVVGKAWNTRGSNR